MRTIPSTPHSPANHPQTVRRRLHHLRVELVVAGGLLLFLTWGEHLLPDTKFGRWLAAEAYSLLHTRLAEAADTRALQVVLVDLTDLQPSVPFASGTNTPKTFTSRAEIQVLIEKLASARQVNDRSPVAIGVDIDLSPEEDGSLVTNSFPLFDACLRLTTNSGPARLPVFLGVRRMEALGRAAWLGHPRYARLAASIDRPNELVPSRMLHEYRFSSAPSRWLKSLSFSLAQAHHSIVTNRTIKSGSNFWARFTDEVGATGHRGSHIENFTVREFYVDYSQKAKLSRQILTRPEVIGASSPALAARLEGKVVIVGDARSSEVDDSAVLPGQAKAVPGLYVHACAADTLISARLRVLKPRVGIVISLLLGLLSILIVQCACRRRARRGEYSLVAIHLVVTPLVMGLNLLLAGLLLLGRVLFIELLVVWLVLFFHLFVVILVESLSWKRFWKSGGSLPKLVDAIAAAPPPPGSPK